jgi:hypothetical protein
MRITDIDKDWKQKKGGKDKEAADKRQQITTKN